MGQYFLAVGQYITVGSDMKKPLVPHHSIRMEVKDKTTKQLLTYLDCKQEVSGELRLYLQGSLDNSLSHEALRLGSRIVARLFNFERTIAFESEKVDEIFQVLLVEDGFEEINNDWVKTGHFSREKKAENFLKLYEEPLWVPWNYSPLELDVVQYFLDFTNGQNTNKIRVLDIGSGYGKNALFLEERGYEMYGIDISEIAIADAKCIVKHPENFKRGIAEAIPFEDDFFDFVLDVGCIHCSEKESLGQVMSEIQRVLKPRGKLFSRIFTPRPKAWLEKFAFKMYDIGLSVEEIETLMKYKLELEILDKTPDSTYLMATKK